MKMYRVIDGVMHSGEVTDGAVCMDLMAQSVALPEDKDELPPIVSIDYGQKMYKRAGWDEHRPWPPLVFHSSDVTWTPVP